MSFLNVIRTLVILGASLSISCAPKPGSEDLSSYISAGDLIVSNAANDSLILFDSQGNFKKVLLSLDPTNGEAITGITINSSTNQILVVIDGVDRVLAIDRTEDTAVHDFIVNVNLTGTLRGITQLPMGDVLIVETSNIERFDKNGVRVISDTTYGGTWPKALQTTATDVSAKSDDGFVHCSTGTAAVRVYDKTGVQTATAVSGIAGTTAVASCINGPNDSAVYATFSGTTDTVRKLGAADLSTTWSYSNLSILSTPSGMGVRANGNVIVLDSVLNHAVEISSDGTLVGVLNSMTPLLSTPQFIYVVP